MSAMSSSSHRLSGTNPATLIEPSGFLTVSFLASAASSVIVLGGPLIPAFWNIFVL